MQSCPFKATISPKPTKKEILPENMMGEKLFPQKPTTNHQAINQQKKKTMDRSPHLPIDNAIYRGRTTP